MPSYDEEYKKLPRNEATAAVLDHLRFSEDKLVGPLRPKLMERYRGFRSHVKISGSQNQQLRTQIALPLIFSHIKTYSSRFAAQRPRIEVWERTNDPDDRELAEKLRALMFSYWDHLSMVEKACSYFEYSMIMGTAVWKVGWRKEVREIEVEEAVAPSPLAVFRHIRNGARSPSDIPRSFETVTQEVATHDDPTVELMELDAVYPHPSYPDWYSSPWIVERQKVSLAMLRDAQDPEGNPLYDAGIVAKLAEWSKEANPEVELPPWASWSEPLESQKRSEFGAQTAAEADPWERNVTVITEWTDGKQVAAILERPDLEPIRNAVNAVGIKPFCVYSPNPLPNEQYGLSAYEILNPIWRYTNALYGAQLDHAMSSAHPMTTVERTSSVNLRELRRRPDGVVMVDDHDDIRERATPRQDFALPRLSEDLRRWAQQAMGSPSEFMGASSRGGKTATEVATLGQAAGFRANQFFILFNQGPMKRLGQLLIRYTERHLSTEKQARILGDELAPAAPVTIRPEDLRRSSASNFDVIIDVAAADPETRGFRLQEAINALTILSQSEPPDSPVMQKFKILLLQGLGVERPQQLVEQSAQMIAQLRQQAAAGQQGESPQDTANLGEELAAEGGSNAPNTFMKLPGGGS